jgi:hypothetical protein
VYWRDEDGSLTGTAGATVLGSYLAQRDGSLSDQGTAVAAPACAYVPVSTQLSSSAAAMHSAPSATSQHTWLWLRMQL